MAKQEAGAIVSKENELNAINLAITQAVEEIFAPQTTSNNSLTQDKENSTELTDNKKELSTPQNLTSNQTDIVTEIPVVLTRHENSPTQNNANENSNYESERILDETRFNHKATENPSSKNNTGTLNTEATVNENASSIKILETSVASAAEVKLDPLEYDKLAWKSRTLLVKEDDAVTLSSKNIQMAGSLIDPAHIHYEARVTRGYFEHADRVGTRIHSFTQEQINEGEIRFVHEGGEQAPRVRLSVNDGITQLDTRPLIVRFVAVNDAPQQLTPADLQILNENATLFFSEAQNNAIRIRDTDAADAEVQVNLAVAHGRLSLSTTSGVTVTGNNTEQLVLTGKLELINTAMDSLSYQANSNYVGQDSLTITTNDLGNRGVGGEKTASDVVLIRVVSVNDAPVLANNQLSLREGESKILSSTDLKAADPDGDDVIFRVSDVSHGQFELIGNPGVAITRFNQSQIEAGRVKFVHDGSEVAPSYKVIASDGELTTAASTATVSFTVVNDTSAANNAPTAANDSSATSNHAPTAANVTVTTNEDTAYTFTVANFGFSDADTGDSLSKIKITSLEAAGSLKLNGTDVTLNQEISAAAIAAGKLKFTPATDANGTSYDSFQFKVSDGTAYSTSANTIAVNVTAVNDAPTASNTTVTTNEDTAYTFTAANFGFSDADGNSLSKVQITSLETVGSLKLDGVDVTLNQEITAADIAAGKLSFNPVTNGNGAGYDSFTFKVSDGTAYSATANTLRVNVTAVNDTPTAANATITLNEDASHVFAAANFGFTDVDTDDSLATVRITALPSAGTLTLNGAAVSANQNISGSAIAAGQLVFTPAANANGNGYATISFKVGDGTAFSNSANTLTLNVTAVNDAPTAANATITTNEDNAYTFSTGNFGFSDVEGDLLDAVKITALPGAGTLTLNGVAVNANQDISVSAITAGQLVFTPATNANGNNYTTIDFKVSDGTAYSATANTLTVNVTAVNDAPTAANVTVTTNEDTAYTFTAADFGFSDVDTGNSLSSVKITTLETVGALKLDGVDVTLNQEITAADIAAGKLSFNPVTNGNGAGYDSIGFKVSDGATYSTSANTITVNVTAVNDAPINTVPGGQSINEDSNLTFSSGNNNQISAADIDASTIRVTLSVNNGALTLGGTSGLTFTAGDGTADSSMTFSGAKTDVNTALNGLVYAPTGNYNGSDTLTITTSDSGSTGSGGTLTDTDTVTITVNAVNDTPTASNATVTTNEDTAHTFTISNFGFSDVDTGDSLSSVKITSLETVGALKLDGADVTLNQEIAVADIAAGKLRFTPVTNGNGNGYDSFQFKVSDGTLYSATANTITLNVTAVNDTPVNTIPTTQTMNENTTLTFNSGNSNLISISDLDAGSNSVQVALTGTNGTITLSGTSGLTFSAGDGTADSAMTFTGTVANINTALNGLIFTPTTNYSGTAASIQIVTNDQGNTGGGALTDTDTINITVNDAPINTVPGAQAVNEDTNLVFNSGNSNAITVGDTDNESVTTTLSINNGTLTLSGTTGLTFTTGDGTSDTSMAFSGTKTAINNALSGLIYTPTANYNGSATLTIVTADSGGTSDTDTVAITVNAINDAPANSIPGAQTVNEDTALVFNSGNSNLISISDVDASSSTVQVTLAGTNGTISLSGTTGLTFSAGDGTADSTMTFTGTVANINTALDGLSFTGTANYNGAASLQITTNDLGNNGSGGALTDTDTINVTVNAVNDAPVSSIPGSQTVAEDGTLTFSSGNSNLISISDADANSSSVQVILTGSNGVITLGGTSGLTFSAGDGTADSAMTFTGTVANINTALSGMSFSPTADYTGAASIRIQTSDQGNTGSGGTLTDDDTLNITVSAVNDAPVNTVPTAQTTNEDTNITFSSGNSNAITISDADISSSQGQVTLSVTNGVLTLAATTGLTFTVGDGTSDATMTFRGTVANINTALNGLVYAPTLNYNGSDTLTITTSDLGGTGSGGAQTDTDTVSITLNAVNDAPVITGVGGSVSYTEGGSATVVDSAITLSDVDNTNLSSATIRVSNNFVAGDTLNFTNQNGISGSYNAGTGVLTLSGSASVANYKTALESITFSSSSTNPTSAVRSIEFTVSDGTASTTASSTVTMNVTPVESFTLTTGTDVVNFLDSTSINTVYGTSSTLNSADQLTGSAGSNDILSLTGGGSFTSLAALATFSGFEQLNIDNNSSTITLNNSNLTVTSGSGNDVITLGTANYTVNTNAGNDTISAVGGNLSSSDVLNAGGGADILQITTSAAVIDTSSFNLTGFETFQLNVNAAHSLTLDNNYYSAGSMSTVTVTTTSTTGIVVNAGSITGSNAINVTGGTGADTITMTQAGTDIVSAGSGNDTIIGAGIDSSDTISGSTGTDVLQVITNGTTIDTSTFTNLSGIETFEFNANAAHTFNIGSAYYTANSLTSVTVTSTSNVGITVGASGLGATNAIVFTGDTGNDSVSTGSAADTITLNGGGNDSVNTGAGNDLVIVSANLTATDTLNAGTGTDTLRITTNTAAIDTSTYAVNNFETFQLNVSGASLTLDDTYYTTASITNVTITTSTGGVVVNAGAVTGTKTINATGGTGVDSITGGAGADIISGGGGNDTLIGGGGNDTITSSTGDDSVSGGAGNDTLSLSTGNDIVNLDDGNDILNTAGSSLTSLDTINAGTGTDTLNINSGDTTLNFVTTLTNIYGFETIAQTSNSQLRVIVDNTYYANTFSTSGTLTITSVGSDGGNYIDLDMSAVSNSGYAVNVGGTLQGDIYILGAGSDTIANSSSGNDTVTMAYGGSDIINTDTEVDLINAGQYLDSTDTVNGGGGTDTLTLDGDYSSGKTNAFNNVSAIEILTLAAGNSYNFVIANDTLVVSAGTLTVNASALLSGQNLIWNGAAETNGRFSITAGAGNDTLTGSSGNDTFAFVANLTSADIVNGGVGTDTLTLNGNYATATTALNNVTNVETITLTAGNSYSFTLANANVATGQTLTINGSALITGQNLTIDGAAETDGNLSILAGAGTDTITGGTGSDTVIIAGGNFTSADTLSGGSGADILTINSGTASINTSTFSGFSGFETIQFNANAAHNLTLTDSYYTATGISSLNITTTSTTGIVVNASALSSSNSINLTGGSGADTVTMGAGNDTLNTGAGNDSIVANQYLTSGDTIDGSTGTDTLTLNGDYSTGNTTAFNNVTNIETVVLTAGNSYNFTLQDAVVASAVTLTLNAGALVSGQNLIWNASAETNGIYNITSGAGGNTLTTGSGNDIFTAGTGTDTLTAGSGNDSFTFAANLTSADIIDGGTGTDTLTLNGNYASATTALNNVTNVETITLTAGNSYSFTLANANVASGQTLTINGSALTTGQNLTIDGSLEADGILSLVGGAGNDVLTGGSGNDTFVINAGNDTVTGNAGNDLIVVIGANLTTADTLAGNAGTDTLQITTSAVSGGINTGTYNISGIETFDFNGNIAQTLTLGDAYYAGITGTVVTVTSTGVTSQIITVNASALTGSNAINATGGSGNDVLTGGTGNDTLVGSGGVDTLTGGGGDDILAVSSTAFAGIYGGVGSSDTLRVDGSGVAFNLTTITNDKITDIEIIDITGSGNNTLTLNPQDVADISSTSNQVIVKGNTGDTVNLSGYGWTSAGTTVVNSVTYNSYTSGPETVLVDQAVAVKTDTVLDLHLDGTNGSTTITDSSTAARTVTAVGNAQLSTATSQLGVSSLLLDGTGDYLSLASNSTDLDFGTGNFTIQMAVNFSSLGSMNANTYDTLIEMGNYADGVLLRFDNSQNKMFAYVNNSNGTDTFAWTPTVGTWYDVALVRQAGQLKFYVNGVQTGSAFANSANVVISNNSTSTDGIIIGTANHNTTQAFHGYLDEVVISKTAPYTGTSGNDTLTGTANSDIITPNAGDDTVTANAGDDYIVMDANYTAADVIDGGAGTDTLYLNGNYSAGVTLTSVTTIETINLTAGNSYSFTLVDANVAAGQTLNIDGSLLASGQSLTVNGAAETDGILNITGGAGNDSLTGGAGNDTLVGNGGSDSLVGGGGDDMLAISSATFTSLAGGSGTDTLRLDGASITLDLTSVANSLTSGIENINITGSGNNTLTLNLQDVLDLSDTTDALYVRGNAGDTVNSTGQSWVNGGTTTVSSVDYTSYTSGTGTLLVETAITANIS